MVERLGFSAVGGFMGDFGTRVTLGRELGDSARDEDNSCDSLLAEFSRVALELVDNSLEVDLTDPQLLSLLTGDRLTTSSSSH